MIDDNTLTTLDISQNLPRNNTPLKQFIQFSCTIVPTLFILGLLILFQLDSELKIELIQYFTELKKLDWQHTFEIVLIGVLLVIGNAPYMIFEMTLGYVLRYPVGLAFAVISKLIGEIICFSISRYLMKNFMVNIFKDNETFWVIYGVSQKYPWQICNIMRANALIPLFIINFGSGLLEISWFQYMSAALFWGLCYSCFTVYVGSQFSNLHELIKNAKMPTDHKLVYFEIIVSVVSIIIFILICLYTNKIFQKMKNQVQAEKIIENDIEK